VDSGLKTTVSPFSPQLVAVGGFPTAPSTFRGASSLFPWVVLQRLLNFELFDVFGFGFARLTKILSQHFPSFVNEIFYPPLLATAGMLVYMREAL